MKLDDDFAKKLMEAQLGSLNSIKGILQTIYYYVIDSKFYTRKKLNNFLEDQLIDPSEEIVHLAKLLRKPTADETIVNILKWVLDNFTYKRDIQNYNKTEYWATAEEAIERTQDDCDGMNGVVYILARLAGIPSYVLYSVIGTAGSGGHYWLVYWSTKCHKLVAIDATFYPRRISIKSRLPFALNDKYKNIWYIFNDKRIFSPRYK